MPWKCLLKLMNGAWRWETVPVWIVRCRNALWKGYTDLKSAVDCNIINYKLEYAHNDLDFTRFQLKSQYCYRCFKHSSRPQDLRYRRMFRRIHSYWKYFYRPNSISLHSNNSTWQAKTAASLRLKITKLSVIPTTLKATTSHVRS